MGCNEQAIIDCINCDSGNSLPAQSTCGCACAPGTPTPYYKQAQACEQEHKHLIIQNQYALGVATAAAVVMPLCNESVLLTIPGLQSIVIGSYLWNPTYGYLKVQSFDVASQTVIVVNECQEGNAAAGTTIPACTYFSATDTPTFAVNPCNVQATTDGALMVCDGGDLKPLAPSGPNQIPISTGTGNNVSFQTVDVPTIACTTLTADLTLILGNTGPYDILVADSSIFAIGDLLQISGRSDRFTVTNIISGLHIQATVSPAPSGSDTISAGVDVCLAPCCEGILNLLAQPCFLDLSSRFYLDRDYAQSTTLANGSIAIGATAVGTTVTYSIDNALCKSRICAVTMNYFGRIHVGADVHGHDGQVIWYPYFGDSTGVIGAVPAPVETSQQDYYMDVEDYTATDYYTSFHWVNTRYLLIPAGYGLKLSAHLELKNDASDEATFTVYHTGIVTQLEVFMVGF